MHGEVAQTVITMMSNSKWSTDEKYYVGSFLGETDEDKHDILGIVKPKTSPDDEDDVIDEINRRNH